MPTEAEGADWSWRMASTPRRYVHAPTTVTVGAASRPTEEDAEVIQHIVLLKWKPGTDEDRVLEAFSRAEHLANQIEGVQRLTLGRNRVAANHGYTHALIVQLADEEALRAYLDHPLRKRYISEHMEPIEAERIEIDVPVDMVLRRETTWSWELGAGVGMGMGLHLDDL
jgi:hypothetical protein